VTVRSQCDAVLAALKRREKVTPYIAFKSWGCLALHSRISELRGRGHRIDCRVVRKGVAKYGDYSLAR